MRHKKLMSILIFNIMLIGISAVHAEDNEIGADSSTLTHDAQTTKTFTTKGGAILYTKDNSYYPIELTKKAKKQWKKIIKYNKKHKRTYKVTLTAKQYNRLLNAKKQGKTLEIQVKTKQYIKIYKPVVKKRKKVIFRKNYYKSTKFEKAAAKLKNKYEDDENYEVIVDTYTKKSKDPGVGYITDHKKITIIKKYYEVKRYKVVKDRVIGSVVVRDFEYNYKDSIYFFAPKLGIDGTIVYTRVKV